jgi:hypothetical protein
LRKVLNLHPARAEAICAQNFGSTGHLLCSAAASRGDTEDRCARSPATRAKTKRAQPFVVVFMIAIMQMRDARDPSNRALESD